MRSSIKSKTMTLDYASPPAPRTWLQIRRNAALDLVDLAAGFRGFLFLAGLMALFLGPRQRMWGYVIFLVLIVLVCETIITLAWRQRHL